MAKRWKLFDRDKTKTKPDREDRKAERKKRWTAIFSVFFQALGSGIAIKWGWMPALALSALILLKGC